MCNLRLNLGNRLSSHTNYQYPVYIGKGILRYDRVAEGPIRDRGRDTEKAREEQTEAPNVERIHMYVCIIVCERTSATVRYI